MAYSCNLNLYSHLICTLISENQGLDRLRSVSNLMKISVPVHLNFFSVHLNFFSVCNMNFFQIYGTNQKKIQLTNWKKIRCAGPGIFLRFETDLNFSRHWFSEMKVQIKWPMVWRMKLRSKASRTTVEKWHPTLKWMQFVRNHVKLGVSLRVLYCVVDTGYGLGRSLGDCRPALPKGRKYQMVITQTESHVRRPVVWTNRW